MAKKFQNITTHPAMGVSKKTRSAVVKKARKGQNVFGGKFNQVAAKAAKEYGSAEAGRRVAAAAMWKRIQARTRKHG